MKIAFKSNNSMGRAGQRLAAFSRLLRAAALHPSSQRIFRGRQELYIVAATTALACAFLMFLPTLGTIRGETADWPGFMLTLDVRNIWFPQFMEGYQRFHNGSLFGIDFLTHGGATSLAMRPNLLPFYPPFLASYVLFDISNVRTAGIVFVAIHVLHTFVGAFCALLLGRRYLGLSLAASVLFSAVYCLSFQAATYVMFTTSFFQAMLVPVVAYALCRLLTARSWLEPLLTSPVVVLYMMTSYGPTMAAGLVVSCIVVLIVFFARYRPRLRHSALPLLIGPFAACLIGALVAAPYYFGQADALNRVAVPAETLGQVAHEGAFNGQSLIIAFLQTIISGASTIEARLYWGLLPAAIILIGLAMLAYNRAAMQRTSAAMLGAALTAYVMSVLITLKSPWISDAFYYAVPLLGRMHLYSRYLLYSQIFLSLAVAICAGTIMSRATPRQRTLVFLGGFVFWIGGSLWVMTSEKAHHIISVSDLLPELFLAFVGTTILALGRNKWMVAAVAVPIVVVSLQPIYDYQRDYGQNKPEKRGTPEEIISFWDSTVSDTQAILSSTGKTLPKVLILSDVVDSYFPHNYSWMMSGRQKFMNYWGYDYHLALERDYWAMMGGWFGRYNREWVLRTGVDFIVWDAASKWKLGGFTADTVTFGATHPMGGGQFMTEVKYLEPPQIGQRSVALSLPESHPAVWRIDSVDGWRLEEGRMVATPEGATHQFGIVLKQRRGASFEISLDVRGSRAGSVSIAFGGQRSDPIPGDKPGRYSRRVDQVDGINDLWISGTPDFDGTLTNIVVREVTPNLPPPMTPTYDNGILRLEGNSGSTVTEFDTNWGTRIRAKVSGKSVARMVYQLWPSRYLHAYVDGHRANWTTIGNWPAFVEIPPGEHLFEIKFESKWSTLTRMAGIIYVAVLFLAIAFSVGLWAKHRWTSK
jgi:hypothetical protein